MMKNIIEQLLLVCTICAIVFILYDEFIMTNNVKKIVSINLKPVESESEQKQDSDTDFLFSDTEVLETMNENDTQIPINDTEERKIQTDYDNTIYEDTKTIAEMYDEAVEFPRELENFENGQISGYDSKDLYTIDENPYDNMGYTNFATY